MPANNLFPTNQGGGPVKMPGVDPVPAPIAKPPVMSVPPVHTPYTGQIGQPTAGPAGNPAAFQNFQGLHPALGGYLTNLFSWLHNRPAIGGDYSAWMAQRPSYNFNGMSSLIQ